MRGLFLLLCAIYASAQVSQVTIHRITDYDARHQRVGMQGWIPLRLHPDLVKQFDNGIPIVKRVLWCKALEPNGAVHSDAMRSLDLVRSETNLLRDAYANADQQQDADIRGCHSPGLVHMQIYPGSHVAVHQPVDEPGVLYIDPTHFYNGWETNHQMDVVVEMRVNPTTTARNIVRFNAINPLSAADEQSFPAEDADTFGGDTAPTHQTHQTSNHTHPWGGVAALFFVGAAVMVVLGAAYYANLTPARMRRMISRYRNAGYGEELRATAGASGGHAINIDDDVADADAVLQNMGAPAGFGRDRL